MSAEVIEASTSWPEWLEPIRQEYSALGDQRLRSEFEGLVVGTVENIRRMAVLVRLLEERHVDMDDIKGPWLDDIRRVAYGQLVPELIVLGMKSRSVLRQAKSLPVPDQMKIAKDEPLPVVVPRPNGPEPRFIKPSQMEDWQLRQVIAPGRIRSEKEQVDYLDRPNNRPRKPPEPIIVDKKNRCLIISGEGIRLTVDDLLDWAKRLAEK